MAGYLELVRSLTSLYALVTDNLGEEGECPDLDDMGGDAEVYRALVSDAMALAAKLGLDRVAGKLAQLARAEQVCPDDVESIILDLAEHMARELDRIYTTT